MIKFLIEPFRKQVTKEQSKDTGMALVLLFLLSILAAKPERLVIAAVLVHLINMIAPMIFRPVAVVWLGMSHLLGTLISKVFLGIVFLGVVAPIGLFRKLMGKDVLQLRKFKSSRDSVMVARNHTYTKQDFDKPY
jgi:hypothetical protein